MSWTELYIVYTWGSPTVVAWDNLRQSRQFGCQSGDRRQLFLIWRVGNTYMKSLVHLTVDLFSEILLVMASREKGWRKRETCSGTATFDNVSINSGHFLSLLYYFSKVGHRSENERREKEHAKTCDGNGRGTFWVTRNVSLRMPCSNNSDFCEAEDEFLRL